MKLRTENNNNHKLEDIDVSHVEDLVPFWNTNTVVLIF